MLKRFLTDRQEALLAEERLQLSSLRGPMIRLEADKHDLAVLDRALLQLDELFLLVIVGEFNAGKSAFINALLGRRVLTEGVTPTTTSIHIIKHGDEARTLVTDRDAVVLTYPVDWLRDINIVDTPGTNAVIRRHEELTADFVPRADLILFITSADRPFSESERAFVQHIRDWGKKVVFIINKVDILETQADLDRVMEFVAKQGREMLGRVPTVFGVSSRQARQAKETFDADERTRLWSSSRFEALESYILKTLDERERLRLKLASPLGIALRLAKRYLEKCDARRLLLREDISTVRTIQAQLAAYEADMQREFRYHLSHIDNVLYAMSERGNAFFDETIRLQRIFDLANADRVRGMFERDVIADTSAQVQSQTRDLIDWMIDQDYRQWQGVTEFLNRRISLHDKQIIGQVAGGFESNRQALLESVGQVARQVVTTYDHASEARDLGDSVQRAVAQTAIVEVGALGLGALLVKLLATTVADVTGVLAAGAIAALGFYVIPNKRRRAKQDLHGKIGELRARLAHALTVQFEGELQRSLTRIRDAIRPYTRFVETQQAELSSAEADLRNSESALLQLTAQLESEV